MVAYNKYEDFVEQLGKAVHDLDGTHVLKIALTNTAPVPGTHTSLADISEIAAGNGYTAGGETTTPTWSESAGTAQLVTTDEVFTAAGGSIGPFRYAVLYNDTPTTPLADPLIGYWDYGSGLTLADTETFTVDFGATTFTLL